MIGRQDIEDARVLDLYAGTGALGIEALSRGASWADFVEAHTGRCRDIRESLRGMGMAGQGRVYRAKVDTALRRLDGGYDLTFVDPPYDMDPWELVMEGIDGGGLLNEGALVVLEHNHRNEMAETYGKLIQVKSRRYGDTAISMYRAQ